MSIAELIEYAVKRRDAALTDGTINNVVYWNGYIDALNRVMEEFNNV